MPISKSEYVARLEKIGDLFKEGWFQFGSEAPENVIALVDSIKDQIGGEFKTQVDALADSYRAQYGTIQGNHAAPMLQNLFRDLLRLAESAFGDPIAGFGDVFDYHLDNQLTVESRAITFDATPTETGTGDNTVYRLTEDSDGEIIENGFCPLDVSLEITADQTGGSVERFEEQYTFSAPLSADVLDVPGRTSSATAPIAATNRDGNFISNASFQNGQSGGTPVSVSTASTMSPWVDSTAAYGASRYVHDDTETYRDSFEETQSGLSLSCQVLIDGTLSQPLNNLDDFTPYFWSFRIMRKASATGTVTLKVGSNTSCTIDLSTLTNDVWTLITPTMDANLFTVNFKTDNTSMDLVTASLATGTYKIDTVTFEPMTQFNGSWWAMLANATPGLLTSTPKKYVWSDTLTSTDSVIQRLIALTLGLYLPSAPAVATTASSGGRTITYADNGGSPDTITASSGNWEDESFGFKAGTSLAVSGSTSNDGNYTIATVSGLVLTLIASDSLTNEGPNSGGETLSATPTIIDP